MVTDWHIGRLARTAPPDGPDDFLAKSLLTPPGVNTAITCLVAQGELWWTFGSERIGDQIRPNQCPTPVGSTPCSGSSAPRLQARPLTSWTAIHPTFTGHLGHLLAFYVKFCLSLSDRDGTDWLGGREENGNL